jgi:hypothetical protein
MTHLRLTTDGHEFDTRSLSDDIRIGTPLCDFPAVVECRQPAGGGAGTRSAILVTALPRPIPSGRRMHGGARPGLEGLLDG